MNVFMSMHAAENVNEHTQVRISALSILMANLR